MFGWGANSLQRSGFGVAVPVLQQDAALATGQLTSIFGALAVGMMAGALLAAIATPLGGTRWVISGAFAGASLAAAAAALPATYVGLLASRFLLGLCTGALLPAMVQTVREWFPAWQRPLALGFLIASASAASLVVSVLPSLISLTGVKVVLFALALPTLVAAVLCALVWNSPPPPEPATELSPMGAASTAMLALGLLLTYPVMAFSTGWLPMLARERFAMSSAETITLSLAQAAASVTGAVLAGIAALVMMQAGVDATKTRVLLLTLCGVLLPAIGLTGTTQSWPLLLLVCTLAAAAFQAWTVLLYWGVADTLPAKGVALGAAAGALAVSVSGFVSQTLIGRLLPASGQPVVLRSIAAAALVGAIAVLATAWMLKDEPARTPTARW
jgi:ACS family hexuronate transporter-like MFS transporter